MVDRWGIPVLKFHFKWTDAELKQVQHMEQTFTSIIETMGGKVTASTRPVEQKISTGGEIIHEVGSIRMGDDPKTSALEQILPVARCEESVCGGCGAVCQQSG